MLHNRGRVSPETEAKVREIIERLDYKPNIFASTLKLSKSYRFAVMMPEPDQDGKYWRLPVKGISRAELELAAHKVKVDFFYYDKYNPETVVTAGRKMIESKPDGLLLAPVLSGVFDEFLGNIPQELPYVFFDSLIPGTGSLAYIGQDSFQSGVLSGRLMQMLIRDQGELAAFRVLPEDYHINERVSGFLYYCRRCPQIHARVYDIDGNADITSLERIFRRILEENPKLRGIFVSNAATHRIAAYIRNQEQKEKIHIIGYDLIDENVGYLKNGTVDFLISQQSERQGYEGLYTLYRHVVLREKVSQKIMMQLDIVSSENVDFYQS